MSPLRERLWSMCVGWDRGSSIAFASDGSWCVQINENRYTRWFKAGGDS